MPYKNYNDRKESLRKWREAHPNYAKDYLKSPQYKIWLKKYRESEAYRNCQKRYKDKGAKLRRDNRADLKKKH